MILCLDGSRERGGPIVAGAGNIKLLRRGEVAAVDVASLRGGGTGRMADGKGGQGLWCPYRNEAPYSGRGRGMGPYRGICDAVPMTRQTQPCA